MGFIDVQFITDTSSKQINQSLQSLIRYNETKKNFTIFNEVRTSLLSSQVTFIYIALLTIQIVSKQLHNIKMGK